MTNGEMAKAFMNYMGRRYDAEKRKLRAYCNDKGLRFSEDIFHDTIYKVHQKIENTGMNDISDKGISSYLFLAFKLNTLRERQYARNKYRVDGEPHQNNAIDEPFLKVYEDLRKDFSSIYILDKIGKQFGEQLQHLFTMKFLMGRTYAYVQRHTDVAHPRQRLIEMKQWLRDNVTKEQVEDAFNLFLDKNGI